jgi:hypothetical protein
MNGESNKFDPISEIFPRFTEKNRDTLLKTAKSLLKIQAESTAALAGRPPLSPLPDNYPQDNLYSPCEKIEVSSGDY